MNYLDDLTSQIMNQLEGTVDSMTKQVLEIASEVADECAEELKTASPKDAGDYASGWKKKKTKDGYFVYNENNPRIEMVLENGHISTSAEHYGQRVGKRPHIYKIADECREKFYNRCQNEIKGE